MPRNLPPLCDTCFKYFTGFFFLTFLETIITPQAVEAHTVSAHVNKGECRFPHAQRLIRRYLINHPGKQQRRNNEYCRQKQDMRRSLTCFHQNFFHSLMPSFPNLSRPSASRPFRKSMCLFRRISVRMCRSKNAGDAGIVEAFGPVQSDR